MDKFVWKGQAKKKKITRDEFRRRGRPGKHDLPGNCTHGPSSFPAPEFDQLEGFTRGGGRVEIWVSEGTLEYPAGTQRHVFQQSYSISFLDWA